MFSYSVFHRTRIILFCLFMELLLVFPVLSSAPTEKIDLGVKELILEAGENYTFDVTYKPEDPSFHALKWNVSDPSILDIDPVHFSVKALKAGTARILAESFDGYAWDICTVTVSGTLPKDGSLPKSGSSFITLSASDRGKITSFSIRRYLDFLEGSEMTDAAYAESAQRTFMVMAAVTPGMEDAESQRALSLGMQEAEPLRNLHVLTLRGTLEQILQFTADNADLKEVYEEHFIFADKPAEKEDDTQKSVTLQGHVEELTSISTAHDLGFTGKGSTIAVIDTGVYPEHPEFAGRVIGQRCYGTEGSENEDGSGMLFHSPCVSEDSADPKNTTNSIYSFSHGSHVTGIAAGKGGIAPEANIVAIQVFTDVRWQCTEEDSFFDWCPDEDSEEEKEVRMCCSTLSNPQDTVRAFDYLIGHAQDYPNLTAVNLSMANSKFHESACDDIQYYKYFQGLLEKGIIPVIAAGNEYDNERLPESGCASNSFAVGALSSEADPILSPSSNHNVLVNITAPGEGIYSSIYPRYSQYSDTYTYYDHESGTSMAAPMVTGAFAIMKQIYPNRSPEQLKQALIDLSEKEVSQRRACDSMEIEYLGCPEKYSEITDLSAVKPVLDFSNLKAFLDKERDSVVESVSVTVIGKGYNDSSDPGNYFTLIANGTSADLSLLEISITEQPVSKIVFTIHSLPEFDEEGKPIAYAVFPADSQAEITGAVYSGYEIRLPSNGVPEKEDPGRTFFRFPSEMTELPRTGFSSRTTQVLGEKPQSLKYDQAGFELEIPSLDVITEIVWVPFTENEYPVQWLGNAAGLLEGSALPGKGVSILTGHNHLNTTEAGPFAFLSRLGPGTKMVVLDQNNELTSFTVVGNELIGADDIPAMEAIANRFENSLTLITCEDELPLGGYANRRVVSAVPN